MKSSPILSIPTGGATVKKKHRILYFLKTKFLSCRNAGKGCIHKTQSGRTLPGTCASGSYMHRAALFKKVSFMPEHSKNTTMALNIFITSIPPMIVDATTYSTIAQ
jgi:hypothetical protein